MATEATVTQTIVVNGERHSYSGQDVYGLLTSLGINPLRHGVAVAVNGEVVTRDKWKGRLLKPGDQVEVIHAVAGG